MTGDCVIVSGISIQNLAKLGDGLAKNPTVMVRDNNNKTENSVIIWAY